MLDRAAALTALALAAAMASSATAADLPAIKLSATNKIPACATPGRLMSFLERRNGGDIDAKFGTIAAEYARLGTELGIRWDTAFFQMLLETGNLKFGGDVSPQQNNFAGLGATGNGAPGESFPDVKTGVKAHLQHLLMYSGQTIENPVAERTRNVQEWGVLTKWQQSITGPMTFAILAKKWAPTSRGYARDIEGIAQDFYTGECKKSDPRPELMADAGLEAPAAAEKKVAVAGTRSPTTEELARRSVDSGLAAPAGLGGVGLSGQNGAGDVSPAAYTEDTPVAPYTIINNKAPEATPPPAAITETADAEPAETAKSGSGRLIMAAAGPAAVAANPAPKAARCSVFTASYGGERAIVIKVAAEGQTNYTVLDVNAGSEKREAEAYIAAYAQNGELVGNFTNHDKALETAFQLCPE